MTWSPGETEDAKCHVSAAENKLVISKRIMCNVKQTLSSKVVVGGILIPISSNVVSNTPLKFRLFLHIHSC